MGIQRFITSMRHAVMCLLVGATIYLCLVVILYRTSAWKQKTKYKYQLQKVNYQMEYISPYLPYIYVITPTYTRMVQKAELTRLSQTLRLVHNLHWILVEDSREKTELVSRFLMQCQFSYTHLTITETIKDKTRRGVLQRNIGLMWLRANNVTNGVVYFADDDNTYDVRLFEEMRYTKRVAVWPVGLVTQLRAEGCIVTNGKMRYTKRVAVWPVGLVTQLRAEGCIVTNGKVTGWFTSYAPTRKYAIDMAGFAVNLRLIQDKPDVWFGGAVGHLETEFLSKIGVEVHDLEPKSDNCTKVLVWHTKTEQANPLRENSTLQQYGLSSSLFEDV